MAAFIPEEAPENDSERIIYDNLNLYLPARDWYVFPNMRVPVRDRPTRPREIDFVILVPEFYAVICLEVKGGYYEVRRGNWHLSSSPTPLGTSPPRQSESAMYALKNHLAPYFGDESPLALGCAVAFTYPSDRAVRGNLPMDSLAWMMMPDDARDAYNMGEWLTNYARQLHIDAHGEWVRNDPRWFGPAEDAMDELIEYLGGSEMIPLGQPTGADIMYLSRKVRRMTPDQQSVLELAEDNERCLIDGAAGTGKTVVAQELAKVRCEAGDAVGMLCSNPLLSRRVENWAANLSDESAGTAAVGTPATLPGRAFKDDPERAERHRRRLANSPDLEGSLKVGYPVSKWTSFIDDTVADLGDEGAFDYLVVDEAQNLCDDRFFKLVNALVKGGFRDGNWAMFGDFTNQNIVTPRLIRNGMEMLNDFRYAKRTLRVNYRNTREIAEEIAKLVRIEDHPYPGVRGPGVDTHYFQSQDELDELLDELVGYLKDRGHRSRQIILLSSGDDDGFDESRAYGGWDLRNIGEWGWNGEERAFPSVVSKDLSSAVRWSNVYDFQGLESDSVILVIPVTDQQVEFAGGVTLPYEKHLNRVLYTGMSRANAKLILVAHESYRRPLDLRRDLYEARMGLGLA